MGSHQKYQPIENYGIIGDLRCAALVSLDGSIDFMCFPDFDSPSIFAKILDSEKGGSFAISPVNRDAKSKQIYLSETNILLTRFFLPEGMAEIMDFMPIRNHCNGNLLVRRLTSIKGDISFKMRCSPRFNYAQDKHIAKAAGQNEIIFKARGKNDATVKLVSACPLHIKGNDAYSEFTLKQGETIDFLFENIHESASFVEHYSKDIVDELFDKTIAYWKDWVAQCSYTGRWREIVIRSALVLKLLISERFGSIIAAPTFSLPEWIGGMKNWDYRFVWIRDASFVIYVLIRLGYKEEAGKFMKWIMQVLKKESHLHVMYGIDGYTKLTEHTLEHLEGYCQSSPVRIGNAAYTQRQLDIYGELIDAIYLYDAYVTPITHEEWIAVREQVNWLSKNWDQPGNGIWEFREVERKYLYPRFMCWVALDRAIRIATNRSLPLPDHWVKERDKIYNSVFADFWDKKKKAFVAYQGAKEIDASCLLMPLMRFISPKDPLWLSTFECVERELVVDTLVYRFSTQDKGMKEGTFSLCSFWFTECLSR
ncbi:MAG: glycoside hydrolase family 15 protein, partial [Verrucomicrobia bacterium]|nr:glycoside hydrolase family 15 protein [Verrucomicrobiota bacterium]